MTHPTPTSPSAATAAADAAGAGARSSAPAVVFDRVTFAYPARAADQVQAPAVENITFTVNEGERLGVLGPNGGGKSTLLKLTLGLLDGYAGEIRVFGLSPAEARDRRVVGYVPQRAEAELAFPITARQVVEMSAALGVPPWRPLPAERRDRAGLAMDVVGVHAFARTPVGHLSGGQFQRVMIARALACNPRLLLLDEPTVGVDVAGQQQFAELLQRLHERLGVTIIVVSHDIRTVASGCDRVACLSRTLHSHVTPRGLTPAVLAEVFRHDVAAIFGDVHVDAHPAHECKHGH